jgi:hypothetical protein
LLKLFFLCCCQFVTAKQTACGKAVFLHMWTSMSPLYIWCSMGSYQPLIIWLYNILTMNLPNACYYRYVSSSNYSDFLKRHLHLTNRLLDQGYQKNYFIRSLVVKAVPNPVKQMSKTILRHTLIANYFWHFCWLPYLYTFSLYENASFIILSAETEYISTRSWYRNINFFGFTIYWLWTYLMHVITDTWPVAIILISWNVIFI